MRRTFANLALSIPLLWPLPGFAKKAVKPTPEPKASYAGLVELISKNPKTQQPVETLEELIPLLPKELRENFTFIYQSRSPHGGLGDESKNLVTPDFPRVVLFSADSRLVVAFTGDPGKPGYDTVETIHFDDAERAFKTSKFILPAAVHKYPALKDDAAKNGQINSPDCLRCHGKDPRPFTDSYPLWPGFYGSVRDTFPKGSPERPLYRKFLKKQKNAKTGVYRLLAYPKGTSVPPYLDPKQYNPNTIEGTLDEFKYLPNTRLGMGLTELNRKRIQRRLESSPDYQKYKYALLSGFLGCSFLPINEQDVQTVYEELVSENVDRIKRLGTVPVGPGSTELNMMELGFYANIVQALYLAKALKVESRDWSMAFEDNSLSFFDGILSSIHEGIDFYIKEDFILEMLREFAEKDPAYKPFFMPYRAYEQFGYSFGERLDFNAAMGACPLLVQRQKDKPVELPPMSTAAAPLAVEKRLSHEILQKLGMDKEPFGRCVTCHEGSVALFTGRKIPFRNPKELGQRLTQKSVSSERTLFDEIFVRVKEGGLAQMPPHGDRLSALEIKDLERYLSQILKRN